MIKKERNFFMGNPQHINILQNCTVEEWNKWREKNIRIKPDLTRIDLSNRDLTGIDFRGVGLFKANFSNSILCNANFRQANTIKANFSGANLTGAFVYGISAWDIITDAKTKQHDLVITDPYEQIITVDNLQLAQFLHLLINNKNIRDIIQAVSNKAVLILGRFAEGHIEILRELKGTLRSKNYLPILFDFEKPLNRDLTETVITLVSLSKLIICDLTNPACIPQELYATIPHFKSIPFQPIIKNGENIYAMFESLQAYPWVKPVIKYDSVDDLLNKITDVIK